MGGRPELPGEEHLPAPEHHRVLPPQEQHGQRHPGGAGAGHALEQSQGHPPGHAREPAMGRQWH
eukprot:3314849-Alexandrium_andersonii.AAC.1